MKTNSFHLKRYHLPLICMIACFMLSFLAFCPIGELPIAYADDIKYIYDDADLLTSSEEADLTSICENYYQSINTTMLILTHNNSNAVYGEKYIEDFYDDIYDTNTAYKNSIILLIDMANRDIFIEGYGLCETYIHSGRGDQIIDVIASNLTNEHYYNACSTFLDMSNNFMNDDSDLDYDHDYGYNEYGEYTGNQHSYPTYVREESSPLKNIFVQLLISLGFGAVIVAGMVMNAGGKVTTNSRTYLDTQNSRLVGRHDQYIRTSVTKVRKPQESSGSSHSTGGFNSHGHSGGHSSGGHSHSTSHGKF